MDTFSFVLFICGLFIILIIIISYDKISSLLEDCRTKKHCVVRRQVLYGTVLSKETLYDNVVEIIICQPVPHQRHRSSSDIEDITREYKQTEKIHFFIKNMPVPSVGDMISVIVIPHTKGILRPEQRNNVWLCTEVEYIPEGSKVMVVNG
jgi:hypothetical protein